MFFYQDSRELLFQSKNYSDVQPDVFGAALVRIPSVSTINLTVSHVSALFSKIATTEDLRLRMLSINS